MKHRFYLDDAANCMDSTPERIEQLCKHWEIKVHRHIWVKGDHSDRHYLSWTGVQTLARKYWRNAVNTTAREMFLGSMWECRRNG